MVDIRSLNIEEMISHESFVRHVSNSKISLYAQFFMLGVYVATNFVIIVDLRLLYLSVGYDPTSVGSELVGHFFER